MRKTKCPTCKKQMIAHKESFRPFCSERCKEIDLGHWFMEDYSVPAVEITTEEQELLISEIEKKGQGFSND